MATYGDNIVPGVSLELDAKGDDPDPIGRLMQRPDGSVEMWGHHLFLHDAKLECKRCETEVEMSPLFQQTTGFRQVVFKLAVFGEYKNRQCHDAAKLRREKERKKRLTERENLSYFDNSSNIVYTGDASSLKIDGVSVSSTNTLSKKDDAADMYIANGTRYRIDGKSYTYRGNDMWADQNGRPLTTEKLLKTTDDAMSKLPSKVVNSFDGYKKERRQDDNYSLVGDFSTTDTEDKDESDTSDDRGKQLEETMRQRLASKLCQAKGL